VADRSKGEGQSYQAFVLPEGLKGLVAAPYADDLVSGWFSPGFWGDNAQAVDSGGRGAAWFIRHHPRDWVLRHYLRGGLMARFSRTRYVYAGPTTVRSIAEFRILADLHQRGFPVPRPVAASYRRTGLFYEAAIILERLENVVPFAGFISNGDSDLWYQVGATIRMFHDAGVFHADLNCFNILVGGGQMYLIDFDKAVFKDGNRDDWKQSNLSRLKRSLVKLGGLDSDRALSALWETLMLGYRA